MKNIYKKPNIQKYASDIVKMLFGTTRAIFYFHNYILTKFVQNAFSFSFIIHIIVLSKFSTLVINTKL